MIRLSEGSQPSASSTDGKILQRRNAEPMYQTMVDGPGGLHHFTYVITGPSGYHPVPWVYSQYYSPWCSRLVRSVPGYQYPMNPIALERFMEFSVLPEYRQLWYQSCYLPMIRGMAQSQAMFGGMMNTMGTMAQSMNQNMANMAKMFQPPFMPL